MKTTKKITEILVEDLKEEFNITDHLINSFKSFKIFTVKDLLYAIRTNNIKKVSGLGKTKYNRICKVLEELGAQIIQSPKINFLIDDIDGIENICLYTKNYIIAKYKLKEADIFELEAIISKYSLNFQKNDIMDAGISKDTAHILYFQNISTTTQLEKAYKKNQLKKIRRIGKVRLKEIEEIIFD